jgi:tRNA modification GTPase
VSEVRNIIEMHLNDNKQGERLRNGLKLAILGKPNVGKSSLMNFLMQREIAIISDIAGTTRDIIEGHLDIGGYPIIIQDTAGIRHDNVDIIEQEGVRRALLAAKEADIKIIMVDVLNNQIPEYLVNNLDNSIILINKIDLDHNATISNVANKIAIKVSITQRLGLNELMQQIEFIATNIAGYNEHPQITRTRHRHQLTMAMASISNFNPKEDLVLAAEDIRMTIRNLSNLTGHISVDEILGEIFSNFCIGK